MTNKNNRKINETNDMLAVTGGFIIPLLAMLLIGHRQLEENKGNLYTPGESIKKSERVAVDALEDHTLNGRIATYKTLLDEYQNAYYGALAPNGHTPYMERPVGTFYQKQIKAANIKCVLPRTLRGYKNILDSYARDSIETRYQYLRDSLKAQKALKKHK